MAVAIRDGCALRARNAARVEAALQHGGTDLGADRASIVYKREAELFQGVRIVELVVDVSMVGSL